MSQTLEVCESNCFKVKNTSEVISVLEQMGFQVDKEEETNSISFIGDETWFDEETDVILSLKPVVIDGKETNLVGVVNPYSELNHEELLEEHKLSKEDVVIQSITEYLEDNLEVGNAIVITTSGCESRSWGLHNPCGDVIIIAKTENGVKHAEMSLWSFANEKCKEWGLNLCF